MTAYAAVKASHHDTAAALYRESSSFPKPLGHGTRKLRAAAYRGGYGEQVARTFPVHQALPRPAALCRTAELQAAALTRCCQQTSALSSIQPTLGLAMLPRPPLGSVKPSLPVFLPVPACGVLSWPTCWPIVTSAAKTGSGNSGSNIPFLFKWSIWIWCF